MPRRLRAFARRALAITGLISLLALPGCGGPSPRESVGGTIPSDHSRAALIPFENLVGREEQGSLFTKVFFAQIVASGAFEVIDPGRVDEVMDSLGIRSGGTLTPREISALGDSLHAPYLLMGSVLEGGRVQTSAGEVPAAGATLRLIETATNRVLWAGVHFRSGEDRETVFGWGRETSAERLVSKLASDMLREFREAGARYMRRVKAEGSR